MSTTPCQAPFNDVLDGGVFLYSLMAPGDVSPEGHLTERANQPGFVSSFGSQLKFATRHTLLVADDTMSGCGVNSVRFVGDDCEGSGGVSVFQRDSIISPFLFKILLKSSYIRKLVLYTAHEVVRGW